MLLKRLDIVCWTLAGGLVLGGCSRMPPQFPSFEVDSNRVGDQIRASREAFDRAGAAGSRGDQMSLAKKGVAFAERCAELDATEPACPFYYALNTGLYYEAKVFGYPSAMVRITEAAHRVNELDPSYEAAGGYRILGKLYLEAPAFRLGSNGISRDLDRSRDYLEKAVSIAPNYPENIIFLAETLIELEEWDAARQEVTTAEDLIAAATYPEADLKVWQESLAKIKQTLAKQGEAR